MKILISGGAGFIGSTVASAAIDSGHEAVILDNLSSGRVEFTRGRTFYLGDIADRKLVDRIFAEHPDIEVVVHCAALIVVPESVAEPLSYYRTNVSKTLDFVDAVLANGCERVIFSSSAAIYQPEADLTVHEDSAWEPLSPYARTKAVAENMLRDLCGGTRLKALSLRYFNPIGADPMMRTGLQLQQPTHALGQLIGAALDGRPFMITGTDYPTVDGTGLRDYVHVWDLARAHVAALERFDSVLEHEPYRAINIGTGSGTTVRELVDTFTRVTGVRVDVVEGPRRPGDTVGAHAVGLRARRELGWTALYTLEDGIRDTMMWLACRPEILPDMPQPVLDGLPILVMERHEAAS